MAEFPFLSTTQALDTSTLPLFRMYAWDFDKNDFVRDGNGKMILLEGNEALKIWITKALKTERFIYQAYSERYGIELEPFIGKVMGVQERLSELKRMIVEALMVNNYIKSVDSVVFVEDKNNRELEVQISITTIYGEVSL